MRFNEHFVKKALPDVSILHGTFPREPRFSIDSRTLKSGDIFVALPGTQQDGHTFIGHALKKGAGGLIIEAQKKDILQKIAPDQLKDLCVLVVSNTYNALTGLAKAWRAQFNFPVIAITGSVGKTSTKETVAKILDVFGADYLVSHGNQNTKLGVSLNILRMREHHNMAIFEVGVSKRGEMSQLMDILRPTTSLITNIGHSHMEGLGSLHDIALEKRDVFKFFTEESIGIINGDQPILAQVSYPHPVIKFGSKTTNQIQARKIRVAGSHISFLLKIYKQKYPIVLKHPHAGSVFNALGATAVAHLLGVPNDVIVKAIQMPIVVAGRFEEKKLQYGSGTLIDDCYNANPESMKAALLAFQQIETKAQKIAVLGDMLELGVNSPFWHRQLGRFLRKVPSLKEVILVGDLVQWTKKTAPVGLSVAQVESWDKAADMLKEKIDSKESVVLIKGSHGMKLKNLVDTFVKST